MKISLSLRVIQVATGAEIRAAPVIFSKSDFQSLCGHFLEVFQREFYVQYKKKVLDNYFVYNFDVLSFH